MKLLLLFLLICGLAASAGVLFGFLLVALEGQKRPRIHRQGISCYARETAIYVLLFLLKPLGWFGDTPRRAAVPGVRRPLLLVPGYGDNRSALLFMASSLRARGWPWVHVLNHRPISAPIPALAQNLAFEIHRLCRVSGHEEVDLVCHSMGAIVATWFLNHGESPSHVGQMVTLAAPFQGTRTAIFGLRREARDISPGSSVLEDLGLPPVPTTSIRSTCDNIVFPAHSPVLPEHAKYTNVSLPWLGHNEMLFSPRVLREVVKALIPAASGEEE